MVPQRRKTLQKFLSEQLEVPVENFSLGSTDLIVNPELGKNQESLLQSLAIGLRAVTNVKKHSQINLRRGEFAYVQNYESMLRGATLASKVLLGLFCVLVVSYSLKYYFYQSQINEIAEQYKKEFTAKFPDQKRKFKRSNITFAKIQKDAEQKLNNSILEKQQSIEEFRLANKESGALRALRDISAAIPKEVKVDVTSFDFKTTSPGSGKLILKAETDNFSSQASVVEALGKVSVLTNIEEKQSGRKPGSDGKVIEFTIHANYEAI